MPFLSMDAKTVGGTPCAIVMATVIAAVSLPRLVVRAPLARVCVTVACVNARRDCRRWGGMRDVGVSRSDDVNALI